MPKEYKQLGVEQNLEVREREDLLRDSWNSLKHGFCEAISAPFAVPTFVRKLVNEETYLQREAGNLSYLCGSSLSAALLFDGWLYLHNEFLNDNYIPALAMIGSNAVSLIFEAGRAVNKKKKKGIEQKASESNF